MNLWRILHIFLSELLKKNFKQKDHKAEKMVLRKKYFSFT